MESLRELHLFAGAGGGILGGVLLGHTCVCAVEIDARCRRVLLQRQRDGILPTFPVWDDIRTFDGTPWRGRVDVVCGGFPCQDISAAGRGAGIGGERSGLWGEMARIVGEVRPRIVFVENSPLLVQRGLGLVLADLAEMGFDARWGTVSASDAGFPHGRSRLWIYADANENDGPKRERPNSRGKRLNAGKKPEKNGKDWRDWLGALAAVDAVSRVDSYAEGRRVFYGLADGMDRFAAIGNGQVPAVAAMAWRILERGDT